MGISEIERWCKKIDKLPKFKVYQIENGVWNNI